MAPQPGQGASPVAGLLARLPPLQWCLSRPHDHVRSAFPCLLSNLPDSRLSLTTPDMPTAPWH